MILVFDLDDTLYPEIHYVYSGFESVSKMIEDSFGLDKKDTYAELIEILKKFGRGKVFDIFLERRGIRNKSNVKKCISTYRSHNPKIKLFEEAKLILENYKNQIYLVTDGNKIVQARKIKQLNIEHYFKKIFITHRYGIKNSKPSLYCFEKIKKIEKVDWKDICYVGDNPNKDFVSLNRKGALTIRINNSYFNDCDIEKSFEAKIIINNIIEIEKVLNEKA